MMNGGRLPGLFHLRKYIVAAYHGDKQLMSKLWKAVDSADRSKTFEVFGWAESATVTKGQGESVERCHAYISNMWDAIAILPRGKMLARITHIQLILDNIAG